MPKLKCQARREFHRHRLVQTRLHVTPHLKSPTVNRGIQNGAINTELDAFGLPPLGWEIPTHEKNREIYRSERTSAEYNAIESILQRNHFLQGNQSL